MNLSHIAAFVSAGVSGGFFLESSYYWAAPYGPGIIVGREGFSSLFALIGGAFLCLSAALLFVGNDKSSMLRIFRYALPIIPLGILVAVGTGWIGIGGGVNPGGISATNFGFPFVWRIVQTSCPPPCVQANDSVYSPLFLALDSGFFAIVGCWLRAIFRARKRAIAPWSP